jgi:hypothetical protein
MDDDEFSRSARRRPARRGRAFGGGALLWLCFALVPLALIGLWLAVLLPSALGRVRPTETLPPSQKPPATNGGSGGNATCCCEPWIAYTRYACEEGLCYALESYACCDIDRNGVCEEEVDEHYYKRCEPLPPELVLLQQTMTFTPAPV